MTYTREDYKKARAELCAINEERKALLLPTKKRHDAASEKLAMIEDELGPCIGLCEQCSEPIFDGDRHSGTIDAGYLCLEHSPTYQDLVSSPGMFFGEDETVPMTAEEAQKIADAHVAAGGKITDSMATQ